MIPVNWLVFAINADPDTLRVGKIWVDDILLTGLASPGAAASPTSLPAGQSTQPPAEEPISQPTGTAPAEAERPQQQGGGLCPAPLFLARMVCLGAGLFKRKRG